MITLARGQPPPRSASSSETASPQKTKREHIDWRLDRSCDGPISPQASWTRRTNETRQARKIPGVAPEGCGVRESHKKNSASALSPFLSSLPTSRWKHNSARPPKKQKACTTHTHANTQIHTQRSFTLDSRLGNLRNSSHPRDQAAGWGRCALPVVTSFTRTRNALRFDWSERLANFHSSAG